MQKANTQTWEEGQDPVTFIDVHEEFSTSVVEKFKILKFKCKVLNARWKLLKVTYCSHY